MPKFLVKFDDVAFASDSESDGVELKFHHVEELNQELKDMLSPSTGIVAVHSASISIDSDDYKDGDYKMFTAVSLMVEAKNEAAAINFKPPVEVLGVVLEKLKSLSPGSIENEGNWEVLDAEPAPGAEDAPDNQKAKKSEP